jgi:hypothetical protein
MFKLLRLAIYGIVGYALYAFVTDVVNASREEEAAPKGRGNRGRAQSSKPVRMTGAKRGGGAGKAEETHDADGASIKHRVGRGVV